MSVDEETRRLLVAYDGTAATRLAIERVAEVARPGDEVSVVNVMPEPGVSSRIGPFTRERSRQRAILEDAARMLARRGIVVHPVAAVGSPATAILDVAERIGADLIVVAAEPGRRAHGLGSPGDRIARRAGCDVLVVHPPGSSR